MDNQKIWRNFRVLGVISLFLLVAAAPVLADVPPNDPLHINSIGIDSGELPAPLPAMPGAIELPEVVFPAVDPSAWPSVEDERAATKIVVSNRISVLRATMNSRYNDARASVASVRSVTHNVLETIGNPMVDSVYDGTTRVSVAGMAQRMSQSIEYGLGYARAVANIGPMGLDLVFVFVGIGWILLMNLLSLGVRLIAALIGFLGKALDAMWKLAILLIEVMRFVLAIIDLFWPL